MIELLMNQERPYGEPEYSRLTGEISQLRNSLCGQLNDEGQRWLEQLTDTYMRQENAVLRDAFSEGFWTAVTLLLEFEAWKQCDK